MGKLSSFKQPTRKPTQRRALPSKPPATKLLRKPIIKKTLNARKQGKKRVQFKERPAEDIEEEAAIEDVEEYKERDLVWAKVKGYSWWPAEVGSH